MLIKVKILRRCNANKMAKLFIVLLVLCIVILPVAAGCGGTGEKAIEKTIEKLIEAENKAIEADINKEKDTEAANTGDGSGQAVHSFDWPAGIPDYVPKMEGNIFSAGREETNERIIYHVAYENIGDTGVDSYENQLIANGWNIFLKQEMESSWMLHAMHEKKGDLVATVNTDDKIGAINFGMDK